MLLAKQYINSPASRAAYLCEYCLIHENDTFFKCQVDHIISLKHSGQTELDNLAYAYAYCNRNKGSDIGSMLQPHGEFLRFYNPRKDIWSDHFELDGTTIKPLFDIAKVMSQIFGFNHIDRIIERKTLIELGKYPSSAALRHMKK
ncbi:MAG: HNH endonuclease [bacterium]